MRIIWLKTELLHPVDKGGRIRTYQMLKELKTKHHITYLALDDGLADDDALAKAEEYAHETITVPHRTSAKFSAKFYLELVSNTASRMPYALQKYVSAEMRKAINDLVRNNAYDIAVCDFLAPAVNVPAELPIPSLLFQHNVEAMIWQRHYEVESNPFKKAFLKLQWQRMFEYEKSLCRTFDRVVAVSEGDAETMRTQYDVEIVGAVPTGVDTHFFSSKGFSEKVEFQIVFTGSMDWLPNEDGIRWFTDEILPLVRERIPKVSLVVVGRNPFPSLVELGERDPSIVVTGRVPDVRPFMARANVFIVPIRIGGGTRLKIYEAMAMGLPVVSTSIGAEGLPLRDGEEILLRDDPKGFADAIVQLLQEQQLAKTIGTNAERTVRKNHGWEKVAEDFACECLAAIEHRRQIGTPVLENQAGVATNL